MLDVQRTSVNAAARRLQALGLVRFGRGEVQILDLAGLRAVSCGCGDSRTPSGTMVVAPQRPAEPASWVSNDADQRDTAA
ncbi:MAG: hypothetical protein ACREEY_01500 [Brevundimonas sp.]